MAQAYHSCFSKSVILEEDEEDLVGEVDILEGEVDILEGEVDILEGEVDILEGEVDMAGFKSW